MRLLMYSQDGAGLGHLRRAGNIAQEVLSRAPGSDVLILSDSPTTPLLPAVSGLDYIKLPTIVKCGRVSSRASSWRTSTLSLGLEQTLELRRALISHTFAAFEPDAVLVDHMPLGALAELTPMLAQASRSTPRPRLYLGLRDVLDAPEVICPAWRESGSYEALQLYEAILIYGCREMYDAAAAYELNGQADKLFYCNYVGPHPKTMPRSGLAFGRREAPANGEQLVLAMCGGGADAFRLAQTFLAALPVAAQRARIRAVLLTGPNMAPRERWALRAHSSAHPVEILSLSDEVSSLLQQASVVVTMAGYNSVCEVVDASKKALVIPRRGPSAEQRIRSDLFAKRGLIRALDPDVLEPATLALELAEALENDALPDPTGAPPMNGAQLAADLLVGAQRGPAR
jgi:predicted glycosyltransferase